MIMTAVGGSVIAVNVGGREFPATADADITRKLGGFENEVQSNGDSSARIVKTRVPSGITGVVVECDDTRSDQEYLQSIADANDFTVFGYTLASGVTYQGRAIIVGELASSSQNATCSFDVMGSGIFTQQ
jgi:hypothetical protein